MLPIELRTPSEIARAVAGRVRALRLSRGWTQREIAERAGLAPETYRLFERTGRISFERLLKLAVILDAHTGFDQIFPLPAARTLADLEQRTSRPIRQRGRRRRAQD